MHLDPIVVGNVKLEELLVLVFTMYKGCTEDWSDDEKTQIRAQREDYFLVSTNLRNRTATTVSLLNQL